MVQGFYNRAKQIFPTCTEDELKEVAFNLMCGTYTHIHRIRTLVPSPPAQQLPAQEDNPSPADHIPMNAQE